MTRYWPLMIVLATSVGCVPAGGGGGGGGGAGGDEPADAAGDGSAVDEGVGADAGPDADDGVGPDATPPAGGLDEPCLPGDICDPGLLCTDGACQPDPGCEAACTFGANTCADDGRGFTVCGGSLEDDCPRESRRIPCGDGRSCEADGCAGACTRPEVLVLLDRSSSMEGARWQQVSAALSRWAGEVDPVVRLGLRVFPGSGCDAGEIVPIGRGNAAVLDQALAEMPSPDAATPIAAALSGLAPAFGDPDEAQYALLITDGSETCAEPADALAAVRALRAEGVRTAIVGVGNGADPAFLDTLGRAGGAAPRGGPAFAFAEDEASIYGALLDFTTRIETCCVDPDEDGRGPLCAEGPDCAPDEPAAWTGATEICDGVDNDCSGAIDEGLEAPPADEQRGVCAGSVQLCAGADGWREPDYADLRGFEADESSCDGQDNDCDGAVDEAIERGCESACGAGRETCRDGRFAGCDAPRPTPEVCGGFDEDCDGRVDEGEPDTICPAQPDAVPVACDDGGCLYACNADRRDANGDLGRPGGDGCEAVAWDELGVGSTFACGLRDQRIECWGAAPEVPAGRFSALGVRADAACALDLEGRMVCFAGRLAGRAPAGRFVDLAVGRETACGLTADGEAVCGPDNFYLEPSPAGPLTALTAGWNHACAVIADGTPRCWWLSDRVGSNYRQTEAPEGEELVHLTGGATHSCGLRADGSGICWGAGQNNCGQNCSPHRDQSRIPRAERFVELAGGGIHTCGVRQDGTLLCWGDSDQDDGRLEPPPGRFTRVWTSSSTSCALREDGAALCWGRNDDGQAEPPR